MAGHKEYEILGREHSVYPGHPITIAYIITCLYSSLEATSESEKNDYCKAVVDIDVPGAGGNVYSALDFLAALKTVPWDIAVKRADQSWEDCDSQKNGGSRTTNDWTPEIDGRRCTSSEYYIDRWKRGQKQADRVKPLLKAKIKTWLAQPSCCKGTKR